MHRHANLVSKRRIVQQANAEKEDNLTDPPADRDLVLLEQRRARGVKVLDEALDRHDEELRERDEMARLRLRVDDGFQCKNLLGEKRISIVRAALNWRVPCRLSLRTAGATYVGAAPAKDEQDGERGVEPWRKECRLGYAPGDFGRRHGESGVLGVNMGSEE